MTFAQRKCLLKAAANGSVAAGQGVRRDVIERCWQDGYLELRGGSMTEDDWILTAAGRAEIGAPAHC